MSLALRFGRLHVSLALHFLQARESHAQPQLVEMTRSIDLNPAEPWTCQSTCTKKYLYNQRCL